MIFLAEKQHGKFNGFWQLVKNEKGELYLMNRGGGHHPYDESCGTDFIEVEKYEDLPFKEYYISDNYKTGWLDRNGRFYGCAYEDHSFVARMCFHKEEKELEEEGWIKITKSCYGNSFFTSIDGTLDYYYLVDWDMTAEQKNWLSLNGFKDPDFRNKRG